MEINFCDLPHKIMLYKNYKPIKINFGKQGFQVFFDYFLNKSEAQAFIGVIRTILAGK
jgi:hypothetical protein